MFERETESIITTARQRIPHSIIDSSSVVLKDIIAADIPHPLKTFFRADVELLLAEEITRCRKGSRFQYQHPEVQALQRQINSILTIHYTFRRDEFHQRLDDAVHMLLNYLVRPQWTLTSVIFETENTMSASALLRLLRYFGPYEHLRSLILRYIEDRKVTSFTRQEFSTLLWKVEGHFYRRKTGYEVAKILTPLYEFVSYPDAGSEFALPVRALVKYFTDKGLTAAVRMLTDEVSLGRESMTQKELGDILEHVRRMSGAFEVEAPAADAAAESRLSAPEPVADDDAIDQQPEEPEPRTWPRFSPQGTDEQVPTPAKPSPEDHDGRETTESDPNGSLHQTMQTPDEPRPDSSATVTTPAQYVAPINTGKPLLLLAINENDRRKFVKKIFKQDDIAFLNALRHIDELPSWRQASVYIDEIFIANDIDPYSPEAVRFIDIVQEKYYPKK